nr:PREDICTED: phosphatidylethanolamine-binding protein 2-like isoform X1 [Bemisia tabaci]
MCQLKIRNVWCSILSGDAWSMKFILAGIFILRCNFYSNFAQGATTTRHTTFKDHSSHVSTSTNSIHTSTTTPGPIAYELHRDKIIPDLSTLDKCPQRVLKVIYEEDGYGAVCYGNTLKAATAHAAPETVAWKCENPDEATFYTIIFVDLDAPSRSNPVDREWLHWIVGNIPDNRLHSGQTIAEYIGPTPMHGNGTHRFVFQLFLQEEGKIHFEETYLTARANDPRRAKFSSKEFAKKYSLGRPHAVNYFLVTWPEEQELEEGETPVQPPVIPMTTEEYTEIDLLNW